MLLMIMIIKKTNIWFRIKGKELWISPIGTYKDFFLTDKKITKKAIKNWQQKKLQKSLL